MERVSEWCWCFVDMSAEPSSQNNNSSVSVELLFSHISVACSLAVSKRNATWQYAHTSNSRETTQIILLASVFLWLSLRTSPFFTRLHRGGGTSLTASLSFGNIQQGEISHSSFVHGRFESE